MIPIRKMKLKRVLVDIGRSQAALAAAVGFSGATIAQLINHRIWPRSAPTHLRSLIVTYLQENGATEQQIAEAFEEDTAPDGSATTTTPLNEDEHMSIRKQVFNQGVRQHFKLLRNPFDEVGNADEFYVNESLRYTRAHLLDACRRGGFVALVGESGSGKTTLRRDLVERVTREDMQIQIIEPFVIGMESSDDRGKTLKAAHIADAIMATIAPHEPLRASMDARYRQLKKALIESYRTGTRHVVVIEEAHALPKATLRHFKRFLELEDGYARLLGVILIGQTELAEKLSPKDPSVREVVQRCELVQLSSLGEHLESYIAFRLKTAGSDLKSVITADGIEAIRARLEPDMPRGHVARSMLHPLAVNNLLIAAMNLAHELGATHVSADVVMEAKWN